MQHTQFSEYFSYQNFHSRYWYCPTFQVCLCSRLLPCQPSRGQVLSLSSDLAALLINSSHTCVSVSVVTSLQPLRYKQRHALYDPAPTEQTTLFISTRSPPFLSSLFSFTHFTGDRHQKRVIIWWRAKWAIADNDENHNKSLITGSNSPVV